MCENEYEYSGEPEYSEEYDETIPEVTYEEYKEAWGEVSSIVEELEYYEKKNNKR